MSTEKRLMAIKDLQEYLGIPRDRVYQIVKNSDIPSVKIGRSYYVYIDNLNKWLSEKPVNLLKLIISSLNKSTNLIASL